MTSQLNCCKDNFLQQGKDSCPIIIPKMSDMLAERRNSDESMDMNEDDIEWSEEEGHSEGDESDSHEEEEKDEVKENYIDCEVIEETIKISDPNDQLNVAPLLAETTSTKPEQPKSLASHLQHLSNPDLPREEKLKYKQCLLEVPTLFKTFTETTKESSTKLIKYKKKIVDSNKKRFLNIEAPILHTLLTVFSFMSDSDSKNKVVAWLMHPENSKKLAHIFKTVLSSRNLWKHAITNSRKQFLKYLNIPKSSTQDILAFPIVPVKKLKISRNFVVHEKCPFYHNDKLCRYKIHGIQAKVRNILQKYEIPVKTPVCGSKKIYFPEEYTSESAAFDHKSKVNSKPVK